jgi:hypothetical protein
MVDGRRHLTPYGSAAVWGAVLMAGFGGSPNKHLGLQWLKDLEQRGNS